MGAEYPSAGDVHDGVYDCLPSKSAYSNLCVCIAEWIFRGICNVVDSVFVYLDGAVGSNNVVSEKPVPEVGVYISDNLRTSRTCVRNTLRSRSGTDVRIKFQADNSVDSSGFSIRLYSRDRRFHGGIPDISVSEAAAEN